MKKHKIYSSNIEQSALDQFHEALEQDFVVYGALMPDAHTGYTLPIGAVVGCIDVVVPSYVGYDIGCGMLAVKTDFKRKSITRNSEKIFKNLYKNIPVGFKHHDTDQSVGDLELKCTDAMKDVYAKGCPRQVGTLGGGNHFIEIGHDEIDNIWIIVHSGSRNVGHKTATHYMKEAAFLHTGERRAKEGHYGFDVKSDLGKDYIKDMNFCLDFALENRKAIARNVAETIRDTLSPPKPTPIVKRRKPVERIEWGSLINRNHNHAEQKGPLWIHRKGATQADEFMYGVIPGNMRDGSFIVEGRGNVESLWSSSHGAGRIMGRKQAKRELDVDTFTEQMGEITAKVDKSTLDESPSAYKDIFEVMREQEDLVTVLHYVKPLINVKG